MLTLVCCEKFYSFIDLPLLVSILNMNSTILVDFGKKVRELRTLKGLSQEQLAHIADVHRTYIGMIERAEKNITLLNIEKIARALNVHVTELLN